MTDTFTSQELAATREHEQQEAARILGVQELVMLHHSDGETRGHPGLSKGDSQADQAGSAGRGSVSGALQEELTVAPGPQNSRPGHPGRGIFRVPETTYTSWSSGSRRI